MRKVKIINTLLTRFKKGEIIDMYSKEEVLASNITESAREWIATAGPFEGFCLSMYENSDSTIDFTGLWKQDFEEVNNVSKS